MAAVALARARIAAPLRPDSATMLARPRTKLSAATAKATRAQRLLSNAAVYMARPATIGPVQPNPATLKPTPPKTACPNEATPVLRTIWRPQRLSQPSGNAQTPSCAAANASRTRPTSVRKRRPGRLGNVTPTKIFPAPSPTTIPRMAKKVLAPIATPRRPQ